MGRNPRGLWAQMMTRRDLLKTAAVSSFMRGASGQQIGEPPEYSAHGPLIVERALTGSPHAGKVLAAIQPHSDDIPIFAAGTVAKLLNEGYTGHLIRVTNDDMAGPGSIGNTVSENEKDNQAVGRVMGFKKIFDL